jgi:predicted transcriptional regulator
MKSNSLLAYIISSDVRKSILYRLLEEPLSLTGLKQRLNTTSPNIIPRLRELEEKCLIARKDGQYYLTPTGMITAKKIIQIVDLSRLIERSGQFLNDHDLSSIPENMLGRMDELGACQQIENNMMNINNHKWYNWKRHL